MREENQPRRDRQRQQQQARDLAGVRQIPPQHEGAAARPGTTASAGARRLRLSPVQERAVDGGEVLPPREGERRHGVPFGVDQEDVVSCRRRGFAGVHAGAE